jgi:2-amino-4-hydroxy-6-hydroxymethyldihydropteridine diphosphokinase/dihydropteroate synthase
MWSTAPVSMEKGRIWGRRVSILRRLVRFCHMQVPVPSRAFAMVLCTARLQRPVVRTLIKHASSSVSISGRRTYGNAFTTPSSRIYTPFRPCQSTINNHSTQISPPRGFQTTGIRLSHSYGRLPHRAFIALGSNMGDRVAMIEQACKEMEATGHVKILRTSSLYETKAMYVLDQDNFVNGACEVQHIVSGQTKTAKIDR